MANQNMNFLSGLLQGFGQVRERQRQEKIGQEEKKARMKLLDIAYDRAELEKAGLQKRQAAWDRVRAHLSQQPEQSSRTLGMPEQPPRTLIEMLAEKSDPGFQLDLIESDAMGIGDIAGMQNKARNAALMERVLGGGQLGSSGGMELSGVKMDTSGNPMLDFARTEVKRWLPSNDGRSVIGVDVMGREVARRPAGPGDRAEEDKPLSPGDMQNFRDSKGNMPGPGMTLRQAQERGFTPVSTAQAGLEISARSTVAVMDQLETLSAKLFTAQPGVGRIGQAGKFGVARMFQSNKDLAAYEAFSQGTLASLIRTLGEKGNLATGDVERAIELLPKTRPFPDTQEVAQAKLAQLRAVLDAATGGDGKKASELLKDGALPAGVPAGSKLIGTSSGNAVYQTPDGKQLIVDP